MAAPIPSAYSATVEHLLDDIPSLFVGSRDRIPIYPPQLQQALHGLRNELVVIYGPAGVGKSDLALNIALGAASEVRVIIVSLELSRNAVLRRLLPLESAVTDFRSRVRTEEFADMEGLAPERRRYVERMVEHSKRVCSSISIVDDAFTPGEEGGRTAEELRRAIHSFRMKGEDILVIVDYMQLLELEEPSANSTEQIDKISHMLASIAHTEEVPIIALSAIGKDGSIRGSSMPHHDADIILKMSVLEEGPDEQAIRLRLDKWRDGPAYSAIDLAYVPAFHLFC